jgi:hypothetical protein
MGLPYTESVPLGPWCWRGLRRTGGEEWLRDLAPAPEQAEPAFLATVSLPDSCSLFFSFMIPCVLGLCSRSTSQKGLIPVLKGYRVLESEEGFPGVRKVV